VAVLKPSILPLLGTSPSNSITSILLTTLGYLVKATWPEQWPGLEGDVRILLASGGARETFVGLSCLLEMLKAYRCARAPVVSPESYSFGPADMGQARMSRQLQPTSSPCCTR
jgi:importin-7